MVADQCARGSPRRSDSSEEKRWGTRPWSIEVKGEQLHGGYPRDLKATVPLNKNG